jgi:TPR repeat protein
MKCFSIFHSGNHLQVAASVGHIPAFYNIGNFYSQGLGGVKQNDKKALLYYEAAVEVRLSLSTCVIYLCCYIFVHNRNIASSFLSLEAI